MKLFTLESLSEQTQAVTSRIDTFGNPCELDIDLTAKSDSPIIEGIEAIVLPEIDAGHFEIKTNLLQLVQANPFYGRESENPHTHINSFKRITSTLRFRNVPNDVIKLMMFPYSLEGAAKTCEAWERFKELLRACPHHGFTELTQVDTFYNGLNENEQDSLNAAAGGNLLSKTTREALNIIENKSKVRYSRNRSNASRMNATSSKTDKRIDKLADQLSTLVEIVSKKVVTPAPVKAVEESCVTYGGAHSCFESMGEDLPNFQGLCFDISFADALLLMPRFAPTIKSLLMKKEKLLELAKIPLNENCSTILLKKLPEKLGDPDKFLIPCNFLGMDVCHALADLGASINLMPLSIWKKLSLPELTPTRMTLELVDRSITYPKGLAEDIFVKVGKFHFPTDFVVVNFEADPRVPLILGRSFLRTGRTLIDVYREEITLKVDNEAVSFNLDQTTRYSSINDKSVNRIDIIDAVCEEYALEFLGFPNSSGGNPTPMSESFTSEFILEEIEAYLKDDSISPEIDHTDFNPEEDICLIEKLLNNDPFQLPSMDLKQSEVTEAKSSIEEPSKLELKDLPSHLEYAFLEENNKLPVIISKGLKNDEKDALLKVLKSHKGAIAWKITDIKGIDPRFCTHKILMEDDYKPTVQSQRRVNLKIHEVIKKEVLKLLDAEMIYPISDSPWVSPVYCVPKKGGITVVANEENELISTCLVTGWRVCIDYRKLNEATRKDHFPLPFMDQMIERLAGNEFYCFLNGFSGYFQIPIVPRTRRNYFHIDRRNFCLPTAGHLACFLGKFLIHASPFRKDDNNGGRQYLVLIGEKCHFMCREGTNIAKIARKQSKLDKHGHGNGRAHKEPEVFYKKSAVVNPQSTLGQRNELFTIDITSQNKQQAGHITESGQVLAISFELIIDLTAKSDSPIIEGMYG
ncbi:reverse transcriptase domain-containing protein [Tanacetum coccineum]|uniref:Reverse transcriptase domain-containing protein n=1 Tax=Tanacetum coccineum TaxID=301880 RepID=A0ABQ5F4Y7_9ASTR